MMTWKKKENLEIPYARSEVIPQYLRKDGIPYREFDLRQAIAKRINRPWWDVLWIWRRN